MLDLISLTCGRGAACLLAARLPALQSRRGVIWRHNGVSKWGNSPGPLARLALLGKHVGQRSCELFDEPNTEASSRQKYGRTRATSQISREACLKVGWWWARRASHLDWDLALAQVKQGVPVVNKACRAWAGRGDTRVMSLCSLACAPGRMWTILPLATTALSELLCRRRLAASPVHQCRESRATPRHRSWWGRTQAHDAGEHCARLRQVRDSRGR